jgi:hypothetical protein
MVTLHVRNPTVGLPEPPAYRNPSFYMFQTSRHTSPQPRSEHKAKPRKGKSMKQDGVDVAGITAARHRKDFERFHSENGVRTVMGSIGPVENGISPYLARVYSLITVYVSQCECS